MRPAFGSSPPISVRPPEQRPSQRRAIKVNTRFRLEPRYTLIKGTLHIVQGWQRSAVRANALSETSTLSLPLHGSSESQDVRCRLHRRRRKNQGLSRRMERNLTANHESHTEKHKECEEKIRQLEQQKKELERQNRFYWHYVEDMRKELRLWHREAISLARRAQDFAKA
ncbi:hypothetical protein N7512_009414 [Penicillium capsulatum]|nr:hypothetical protein N7512_009388 [Penicillium capsulatum]KAJ6105897.1 hypothetical protein N7512_009414 [Penicillium capsulatum]